MPDTPDLTPEARRRVEEAVERMDGHRHGCLANVMMECTCGRDLARTALHTAVAALVSEGEERGRARCERLEAAVREAVGVFDTYARLHAAERTPEGDTKAAANRGHADRLLWSAGVTRAAKSAGGEHGA